jgi:hypothetical protein
MSEEFADTNWGNQNPYIEEEQTTQWPKRTSTKGQTRSAKHTHKTFMGLHRLVWLKNSTIAMQLYNIETELLEVVGVVVTVYF